MYQDCPADMFEGLLHLNTFHRAPSLLTRPFGHHLETSIMKLVKKPVLRCHCTSIKNPALRFLAETFRCKPLTLAAKFGLVTFIEHDGRRVSTFAEDRAVAGLFAAAR
jgi:hypothetical protein